MTALASYKKLFFSITILFLTTAVGTYFFLSRQDQTVQLSNIAAAKLAILPAEASLAVSEKIALSIEVDTNDQAVNTVTANLTYPVETLELIGLNLQDSFATVWFEKDTATPGEVRLTGSLPAPGFSGEASFAKLTFRTKTKGEAKINFSSTSAVFRNIDSVNILSNTEGSVIKVQ